MNYKTVKGTRDFLPSQMRKRNYIFDTIKEVYNSHGFQSIETPAMEELNTLMGKYGDEGDKLLFKILNSGDFVTDKSLNTSDYKALTKQISEKGLRYDLTVPFARFVVNHLSEITFPFKRYQIQPVWRADRPQKGRYREFYQCDADIIGSDSLLNEVDLMCMIEEVFKKLSLRTKIKLNNRKILLAIAQYIGKEENLIDITVAIDKLDKIGYEKVCEELRTKGFSQEDIEKLGPIFSLNGSNESKIESLRKILTSQEGEKGLDELEYVLNQCKQLHIENIEFDITLARGLNYYTGAIMEVKALDVEIGSICGGGRYDNLTGIFGHQGLSGVGISFGADRIYDCLEQLNLFPESICTSSDILFTNFGENEALFALNIARSLREKGIKAEVYPDSAKLKKQMNYANDKQIKFVALIGENEMKENKVSLKNMESGEQVLVEINDLENVIKQAINA
jgi:histidyl-tRNA synthetase